MGLSVLNIVVGLVGLILNLFGYIATSNLVFLVLGTLSLLALVGGAIALVMELFILTSNEERET